MNNNLFDIFLGKEKKAYNNIIRAIEEKNYQFIKTVDKDFKFGLTNRKYIEKILERIQEEIDKDPDVLKDLNLIKYPRTTLLNERAVKKNPSVIEKIIEGNGNPSKDLINIALDNGYMPSKEFIENYFQYFSDIDLIEKLIDGGYKPSNEIITERPDLFSDVRLIDRILDLGFVPTLSFIKKTNLLDEPKTIDRILDIIELTPEILNDNIFYNKSLAQQKIIDKNPELLFHIKSSNKAFTQFWIEAFKKDFIPERILSEYSFANEYSLFSRIIKKHPEFIKYSKISNEDDKNKIDELAICMGYVPTMSDAQNSEYIKRSPKLMRILIQRRPEAIKYVDDSTRNFIFQNVFLDLSRLAIDNGYIPSEKDLEINPRLRDSFDIMKLLIMDNPNLINMVGELTPNQETLLKIAIERGFNGVLEPTETVFTSSFGVVNNSKLLFTETAMRYQIEHGIYIDDIKARTDDYSFELYNFFTEKGFQLEDIVRFFTSNFEVMKIIVNQKPEYITKVSRKFSREEIDELCFLALDQGYIPKYEDDIFGYGNEVAKLMVKNNPNYIEKVIMFDTFGPFSSKPFIGYDEICKLAIDGGFVPDAENMGSGYGFTSKADYNYSYEIMKRAITIKPSLIESCKVLDKDKYDELCRLAISLGYEITSEYVLDHYGSKMLTNYDLMSQYIPKNPKIILDVDIADSKEYINLLNLALDSGLELKTLDKSKLLKLFLPIDESKWDIYLDNATIEILQKTKKLSENNNEISTTINPKFLTESIIENLTEAQIEVLSCYPQLQDKIIEINRDNMKSKLIFELLEKYKNNMEWITFLEKTLENINSLEFSNLLSSIEKRGISTLSTIEKENLIYLLMTDNHLDITSFEELKNIDSIREEYIKMLIERNTLGSLKTAYFEKVYGIDLSKAIEMVKLYGKSLENSTIESLDEDAKEQFLLLKNMKMVIDLNNIEVLRFLIENVNPEIVIKPDLMVTYESKLKYLFTEELNRSFTKPLEEDRVTTPVNGEEEYDIFMAAGKDGKKKCRLMITSIGAYTSMDEPEDYYASWNVGTISSHGVCCSYVGEKNLGTARIKYCCLGFTDYDPGSLHLSAPYDLCSFSKKDSYQITSEFSPMFLLPDDILGFTRHTHNETVWERRDISGGQKFKKQPSYIIYFVDNFEDRLSDPEAMKQWESVKKAASNFLIEVDGVKRPLPIMVVEREKIAKSQKENIQAKLNDFMSTLDPKLIKDIISDYESNYAGNREYHSNISEKYFPKNEHLQESMVGKMIETIKRMYSTNPDRAIMCVYELERAVKSEQEKYNNTQHGVGQSLPSFNIEEALIEISNLKSHFKIGIDSPLSLVSVCEENQREFEKIDIPKIESSVLDSQLSAEEVSQELIKSGLLTTYTIIENEVNEELSEEKLKIHGKRHTNDVLLYTTLIGNSVMQSRHDVDLLMMAAKYHDSGRKTDTNDEHAKAGAEIAREKLKGKYTDEDIAIISTIIEFHEVPRDLVEADQVFEYIASTNGISKEQMPKVRQMAEILKDADALDRTRFITRARLDPKYLKFDFSKRLIKFSSLLQETYAVKDLKEFQCDKEIESILEVYTPQEALRIIRHSNKGKHKIDDIKTFISVWAQMCEKEQKEGITHGR